jgi:hypothetical protein
MREDVHQQKRRRQPQISHIILFIEYRLNCKKYVHGIPKKGIKIFLYADLLLRKGSVNNTHC